MSLFQCGSCTESSCVLEPMWCRHSLSTQAMISWRTEGTLSTSLWVCLNMCVCGCSCSEASSWLMKRGQQLGSRVWWNHIPAAKHVRGDLDLFALLSVFLFVFDPQGQQINEAACDLAREVANEGDALVAGGVSQTPAYLSCKSEDDVKATFKKQIDVFVKKNVDFLIAEVCSEHSFFSPSTLKLLLVTETWGLKKMA